MDNCPGQRSDSSATGRITPCLIVAGVAIATVLMQSSPVTLDALQWHREAGPLIRSFDWMTGHLAHWSWNHLLWDLAAFLILSLVAIQIRPERFTLCFLAAALVIPLEIALNQAQIDTYRGLSGIDSAIFGLIVATLWQNSENQPSGFPWNRVLAVISGILFLAKFGFELITGGTFFVANAVGDQSFLPVPSAHLTGAIAGILAGSIHYSGVKEGGKISQSSSKQP